MSHPTRVFLAGGDRAGWALDEELKMVRETLAAMPDDVELSSIERCEVVHCLNPLMLKELPSPALIGKRVVCHVPGDPIWFLQQPDFIKISSLVGRWIAQSTKAQATLVSLGFPTDMIPYMLDTRVFDGRMPDGQSVASLRRRWSIPDHAYVIGNFMRDSLGDSLLKPKPQKGPDLFLAILQLLKSRGVSAHVLLAGPRRHWLRAQLNASGIPFTFVGKDIHADDYPANILDRSTLNLLYQVADLHLVSSRSEGGPFAILEAAGVKSKILSTPVGHAEDVLEPYCLYRTVDEAAELISRDMKDSFLANACDVHYERVMRNHTPASTVLRFKQLYSQAELIPAYQQQDRLSRAVIHEPLMERVRQMLIRVVRKSPRMVNLLKRIGRQASKGQAVKRQGLGITVSLWHEFREPPYGGGNQFMLALRGALEKLGVTVYDNRMADDIDVHICNSAWFNTRKFLDASRRGGLRMIHRIDGPISVVRATGLAADRALDEKVFELNASFATATVVQSAWSFRHLHDMGFRPVRPIIISNGVNGGIFHANGRCRFSPDRKIRLISTSWSDNPRKGGPVYKWLDEHLDWDRFEYTFVGRTQEHFKHIQHVQAVPSEGLAQLLRQHDIYITASSPDSCSNALLEAMACGLPALYVNDGGHPELVGLGGLPFEKREEIPAQLERLVACYGEFQSLICVPTIEEIATSYLQVMKHLIEIMPRNASTLDLNSPPPSLQT